MRASTSRITCPLRRAVRCFLRREASTPQTLTLGKPKIPAVTPSATATYGSLAGDNASRKRVHSAIASRDLSKKGPEHRQRAYVERTFRRACSTLGALGFGRLRRTPQRPRISPIRVELQHPVVELSRSGRQSSEALEIANILPRLFNDPGIVVLLRFLMSGDHRAWLERLDGVERCDSF